MNTTTKSILARNIKKYLEQRGMMQKDFAKEIGATPSAVTQWLQEKTSPQADMVDNICRVLKISRSELVQDPDSLPPNTATSKTIPLYNSIYSEHNYFSDSNVERHIAVDSSVKADFGIIVASESMSDAGINPTDIAFFTKDYKFKEGRIYAVWMIGSESVILKRVYIKKNHYVLMSENSNMAPIVLEMNEAFIIGELTGIYKQWKWNE